MICCNKINVMNILLFKSFITVGKLLRRNLSAFVQRRNLIVLAVNTTESTTAEKNCTAAVCSADARLFAKMRCNSRYYGICSHSAKAAAACSLLCALHFLGHKLHITDITLISYDISIAHLQENSYINMFWNQLKNLLLYRQCDIPQYQENCKE